jgi:hypothetical protein
VNRVSCIKTAVFAALLLSLSTVLAQVYTPQPFSADFSALAKSGTNVGGKFFFSLPNTRMDMNVRGQNVSTIMNSGTKTSYMVMHAQRMYMEMKPGQASPMGPSLPQIESSFDPKNPCAGSTHSGATCKDLGPDSLNGRSCEKWLITEKNDTTVTVWVDDKLHFPIKSQTSDGSSFELSNIKEGAQPASLFNPPADYRKIDLGGMMGGGKLPQ